MSEYDEAALQDEIDRFEREREAPSARHYVKPRPPKDPAQVYSIRIPVDRLEQLRILADRAGKRPTTMMREWVLERLDIELAHSGHRPIELVPVAEDPIYQEVREDVGTVYSYGAGKIYSDYVQSYHVKLGPEVELTLRSDEGESELPLPFSVAERLRR
jgi:hypothetical protein